MAAFYTIFFIIIGLVMGSFFNVVGLRVPKKESIVSPSSHCTTCHHELTWFELIPVFSYVILMGRCRKCKSRISPIYPTMELITGFLFGAAYYTLGFGVELATLLIFISMLVIIVVSDFAYMLIPDKILLVFGGTILILRFVEPLTPWWDALAGGAIGFFLLFFIAIVSKGGMGGGDIKLYAVIGLVLGVKLTLLSFFFATFLATIVGITGILLGLWSRKQVIPFGPYIATASLIAYFWGNQLFALYMNWFIY